MPWKDRIPIVCMIFLFAMSALTYAVALFGVQSETVKPLIADLDMISWMFFFGGGFLFSMQKFRNAQRKLQNAGIK